VNVRRATPDDEATLRELWEDFEHEVPEPPGFTAESWVEEWADTRRQLDAGGVFLAEDGGKAIGVAKIDGPDHGAMHVHLVHVLPDVRRRGIAKGLLRECVAHARESGVQTISLHVLTTNEPARTIWRRLGFTEVSTLMAAGVDQLEGRLAEEAPGERRASTHVQTDDEVSVERAISHFVPRLVAPEVRNTDSWIRIADPALDDDRDAHGRFAHELSDRLGAVTVALALEGEVVRLRLYERGRMVDEYLSVPTYYGPLSTGDQLALAANPTLISRLTGADREAVHRVAVTGASPAELPHAPQLYDDLARLMGLEP
jgi:ribosomal protein S18 acetylase RimI-like enzyme